MKPEQIIMSLKLNLKWNKESRTTGEMTLKCKTEA